MIGSTHKPGQAGPIARAVTQMIRVQAVADLQGEPCNFDRYWIVASHVTVHAQLAHSCHVSRDERVKGRAA